MNREEHLSLQNRFIRKYKKNTIAVFLSFVLTITLITALLILIHTNFELQNIQWQRLFTPSDCSVNEITKEQAQQLETYDNLEWYAQEGNAAREYQKNSQMILLLHGDEKYITLTGKLEKGSMPKSEDEVVAERWALLNMGVAPEIGTEFDIKDSTYNTTKRVRLTGILSDQPANKKYGLKCLYTTLGTDVESYNVFLKFKKGVDYDDAVHAICTNLKLNKKQISPCPGKSDEKELLKMDVEIMGILILIGLIVFYGIYHIGMISRKKQYGILHAIGMTREQIRRIILLELYELYGVSILCGVGIGYVVATFVKTVSGDAGQDIYLNNTKVDFSNIFPMEQILICLLIIAVMIGIIGLMESRKIERTPIVRLISTADESTKKGNRIVRLKENNSKNGMLLVMAFKYIARDWKTAIFVVLTICVGCSLFTGLSYRQLIAETSREDTKEMFFLNGEYEMASIWVSSSLQGISREDAQAIYSLDGVSNVKTMAGMPVRMIADPTIEVDSEYYETLNHRITENGNAPIMGNDGTDDVYRTILYGYNQTALEELKKYVLEGDFSSEGLAEDEIILSVLKRYNDNEDSNASCLKEGKSLMDYHAGDVITIKYRTDFQTDSSEYEYLKDQDAEYTYKQYKVKAIVYFPYLYDCTRTTAPLMITDDRNLQELCSDSHIHQICLDGDAQNDKTAQDNLEKELITIGNRSENVSTRSLIEDIHENEMLYQKQLIYIIGIAVVALILVLINIITNIKYRMVLRTREVSMFRAIGMSIHMIRKITVLENTALCLTGCILSYIFLQPILRYLYHISDMQQYGHMFHFYYSSFFMVTVISLCICILLSCAMTKNWKTGEIVEKMELVE